MFLLKIRDLLVINYYEAYFATDYNQWTQYCSNIIIGFRRALYFIIMNTILTIYYYA